MNLILLATLCALCILPRFTHQSKSYHCKRPGHECVGTETCDADAGQCGTCTDDGAAPPVYTCTCAAAGVKGENCGITSVIATAPCTGTIPECSADGKLGCFVDGTNKCFCKEDYYGTLCDKKRIVLECSATALIPKIIPFKEGGFDGLVYVKGKSEDATCQLAKDSSTPAAFTKAITFDPLACGVTQADVPTPPATPKTGDKYCMDVMVQYNKDYVTTTDLKVTMCCNTYIADTKVDHDDIIATTVGDTGGYVTHDVDTTATGMTASLLDSSDGAITTATLGQAAKLKFTLDLTKSVYKDFQVWSVGFDSSKPEDPTTAKYLVKDGCAQLKHQSVMGSFKKVGSDIVLEFTVFQFPTATLVYIFIKINICPGTTCTTTPPCTTAATDIVLGTDWEAVGRRKRQANDVDKSQSLNLSFFVLDPSLTSTIFDRPLPKEQSCLASLTFLLPLVVLVIICLMSIIAAMYFCVKLTQRSRGDPERLHGVPGPYKE